MKKILLLITIVVFLFGTTACINEDKSTDSHKQLNSEDIINAYIDILNKHEQDKEWGYDSYRYPEYYVYDIDNDEIPELIIDEIKSEAEKKIHIYAYDEDNKNARYIGEHGSGHTRLCSVPNENGLMLLLTQMNTEFAFVVSKTDYSIESETIIENKNCEDKYDEPYEIIEDSEYLEKMEVNNYKLLYDYFGMHADSYMAELTNPINKDILNLFGKKYDEIMLMYGNPIEAVTMYGGTLYIFRENPTANDGIYIGFNDYNTFVNAKYGEAAFAPPATNSTANYVSTTCNIFFTGLKNDILNKKELEFLLGVTMTEDIFYDTEEFCWCFEYGNVDVLIISPTKEFNKNSSYIIVDLKDGEVGFDLNK